MSNRVRQEVSNGVAEEGGNGFDNNATIFPLGYNQFEAKLVVF